MRTVIFLILLLITTFVTDWKVTAQEIGQIAPDKPLEVFPPNAWGFDLMIGESGFGLGGFYRHRLSTKFTLFADLSISEAKDEREVEYIDPFGGGTFTLGKKNRVFQVPINFGAQYRLFEDELTDNLRPYINAGAGPSIIVTTPYSEEFFSAFGKAQKHFAAGGYLGFGANFGLDKSNLIGLNFRYYIIQLLDDGVEILYPPFGEENNPRKKTHLNGFFVTINFGFMY
jgi:hypothetical protein